MEVLRAVKLTAPSMVKFAQRYRQWLVAAFVTCGAVVGPYGPSVSRASAAVDVTATLGQAAEQLGMFTWERAHALYVQALAATVEGSPQWQEAAFGAAVCAHHVSPSGADGLDEAAKLYRRLAEPALNSRFAARSLMNLGRISELKDYDADVVDLNSARQRYAEVVERFPNDPIASEATLRLAGAHVQTFEKDQLARGIDILKRWLAAHPSDPLSSAMWQYVGDAYFFLKDYRPSLDAYVKCDQIGWTDVGNQGPIYWRMAIVADRYLKDSKTAAVYYTKIIVETPYSGKAYESQLALKAMGLPAPEIKLFKASATTAPVGNVGAANDKPGATDGR